MNPPRHRGLSLLDLVVMIALLLVLGAILVPNFVRSPNRGCFTACKSNLKNLGTAMEMYSTDWGGHYPTSMSILTPNYLKTIPECPSAASDTYSASLQLTRVESLGMSCPDSSHYGKDSPCMAARKVVKKKIEAHKEQKREWPLELDALNVDPSLLECPSGGGRYTFSVYYDTYAFHCEGDHHAVVEAPPNYPQYNGVVGLIER